MAKTMKKKLFWFNWKCKSCGSEGFVEDERLWKFCVFCGGEIKVKVEREFEE